MTTVFDFKQTWNKATDYIRANVGDTKFDTWFACADAVAYENGCLTISLPNQFFKDQYESAFSSIVRSAISRFFGPDTVLEYQMDIIGHDPDSQVRMLSQRPSPVLTNKTIVNSEVVTPGSNKAPFNTQLNPMYNFENYCEGKSNIVPVTIAKFIKDNPARSDFNPFFLHGSVGVGKTHLVQAIGIGIKERYPNARVLYVTMRHFINLLGEAKVNNELQNFVNFYNSLDVLILDDIQELQGMQGTMNYLFSIFNYLHQGGKKLIFTCDRPPRDLDGITDRLIDRFKWGITEELPKPDMALRRDIMMLKIRKNGLDFPAEVIELLAEQEDVTVRELEGMVMGLISRSITLNQPVSLEMARTVITNFVKKTPRKKQINFDMIVERTAEQYNLSPDIIFTRNRQRDIADARQVIMYLASKHAGLSSPAIGQRLGRRHVTVLHGIQSIADRLSISSEMQDILASIEEKLAR